LPDRATDPPPAAGQGSRGHPDPGLPEGRARPHDPLGVGTDSEKRPAATRTTAFGREVTSPRDGNPDPWPRTRETRKLGQKLGWGPIYYLRPVAGV